MFPKGIFRLYSRNRGVSILDSIRLYRGSPAYPLSGSEGDAFNRTGEIVHWGKYARRVAKMMFW